MPSRKPKSADSAVPVKGATPSGLLWVVATPIGNYEDITLRALRVLKEADIIIGEEYKECAKLLAHYEIEKDIIELNEHNDTEQSLECIKLLKAGKKLALVSDAGVPLVADPGDILVSAAIKYNIDVTVVPGASSILTALVRSGMPANSFTYAGFLSRKNEERDREIRELSREQRTIVLMDTPYRLKTVLAALSDVMPNRSAYIGSNLTMSTEAHYYGTLGELADKFSDTKFRAEYVIIIEGANDDDVDAYYASENMYQNSSQEQAQTVSNEYDEDSQQFFLENQDQSHDTTRFHQHERDNDGQLHELVEDGFVNEEQSENQWIEDDTQESEADTDFTLYNDENALSTEGANIDEPFVENAEPYPPQGRGNTGDRGDNRNFRQAGGNQRNPSWNNRNRNDRPPYGRGDRRDDRGGYDRDRRDDRNGGGFNRDRRDDRGGYDRDRRDDRNGGGFNRDRRDDRGGFSPRGGGYDRDRRDDRGTGGGYDRDRRDERSGGFNRGFNSDRRSDRRVRNDRPNDRNFNRRDDRPNNFDSRNTNGNRFEDKRQHNQRDDRFNQQNTRPKNTFEEDPSENFGNREGANFSLFDPSAARKIQKLQEKKTTRSGRRSNDEFMFVDKIAPVDRNNR